MARTILFDMAEVLIAGLDGVEVPIGALCGVPAETVLPALAGAWFHELALGSIADEPLSPEIAVRRDWFYDLMCGRISEDVYWTEIVKREGWRAELPDLKRIMRHHFDRVIPGMPELLTRLAADYDLALLSDHGREWIEYIEDVHSFLGIFKARYYSFEIGTMKRDPAAFEIVLGRLGIDAADCLFVDDNARNIAVAKSVGIDGIRFENASQLESLLPEHGIRV